MNEHVKKLQDIVKEREDLSKRLLECLKHFTPEMQFYIITCRIDLNELREFVETEEQFRQTAEKYEKLFRKED